MAGRLIYVTYASGPFEKNLKRNGWFARHGLGADEVLLFRRADLEADPAYAAHREIFDAPRGAGYYAWKAWFIAKALEQARPDDVVVYHDCGTGLKYRSFIRPRRLLELVRTRGYLTGVRCPQYGPNWKWSRTLARRIMGADTPEVRAGDTIETSISFWTNSPESKQFLTDWHDYCLRFDVIRDATPDECKAEPEGFVEHRYDQAVVTCLAWARGAPWIEVQPQSLRFAKSITLVELDLRSRDSWFWRLVYRAVVALAGLRRG